MKQLMENTSYEEIQELFYLFYVKLDEICNFILPKTESTSFSIPDENKPISKNKLDAISAALSKKKLRLREAKKYNTRGNCKTSVLKLQPLKNACFVAFRRETARACAKLTEFCNRLYLKDQLQTAQNRI
jgi:hypothetical protein